MKIMQPIEKRKFFTIENLVLITFFVAGLAGQWATFNAKLNHQNGRITELEKKLEINNLDVIVYKIDALTKSFDKFIEQYERDKAGHN